MGFTAFVMSLILGTASQATPVQDNSARIPERFHGAWSTDLYRCDDRESGLNLSIDATAITYFEAGDTVLKVTPAESGGIHIQAVYEDYDGMETLGRTLILSDDQQRLTFTYGDGPDGVYLRCPTAFEIGEPDPDTDDTGKENP
jgi:hypothetical protein